MGHSLVCSGFVYLLSSQTYSLGCNVLTILNSGCEEVELCLCLMDVSVRTVCPLLGASSSFDNPSDWPVCSHWVCTSSGLFSVKDLLQMSGDLPVCIPFFITVWDCFLYFSLISFCWLLFHLFGLEVSIALYMGWQHIDFLNNWTGSQIVLPT